jgi:hypothetical protein
MMAGVHFYAIADDIKRVIEDVEENRRLNYHEYGVYPSPAVPHVNSGSDIPNLGYAGKWAANRCKAYLVIPRDVEVIIQKRVIKTGEVRFEVDQRANPN